MQVSANTAPAEISAKPGLPALSQSRFARFAAIILLYSMQGVPVGLTLVALPAWLAANGAGPVAVGAFVGTALLPWSLKLFGGLLMDRFLQADGQAAGLDSRSAGPDGMRAHQPCACRAWHHANWPACNVLLRSECLRGLQ